jgi:CPA2 family monovalent cation:H+ antiporter-2
MHPAQPDLTFYKEALIVLGAAGVVIPVFHRLRISPVLGFIIVGIVVGPFGLGSLAKHLPWLAMVSLSQQSSIEPIADLGVSLLLFMIGLELSFERLRLMRRLVFGLGASEAVLTAAALAALAGSLGMSAIAAAVIGVALAMSSTAVVLQVLAEERRLNTAVGRASFGILLFQDLAVVPVLFTLGTLDSGNGGVVGFAVAAGRALLAVVLVLGTGRLLLRPLFRSVARTRSADLFVAACLLVVIASALATAAAGLSMALGALIGGLLLAGTEFRREVEVTIDPFKGLLVGVFLISVGMDLDLHMLAARPVLVLAGIVSTVFLKMLIVAPLARVFGLTWANAIHAGLLLGPGGEFSFVIVAAAVSEGFLPRETAAIVQFVTALTMATIPLLSKLAGGLTHRLAPRPAVDPQLLLLETADAAPRVIIAGFGRVGRIVAAMLDAHKLPYVAIDIDPDRVGQERSQGHPVYFGDLTRIELLRRLHLETARALVVTLDEPATAEVLVAAARAERPDLLIVARARDARHAARLYRAGASDAVPETIEASLQLSEAVLVDLGIPMGPVIASIHEKRAGLQTGIRALAPEARVRELGRRRLRDT